MAGPELDFDVEHRVGHLLRRAYHRAKGTTGALLREIGVTPVQAAAVMALRRGGALSQAELGRAIGMEPANVHGLVTRLKKLDIARVQPHPSDHRQVLVALSANGETAAERIAALSAAATEQTLAMLSPSERAQFMDLLTRVATA